LAVTDALQYDIPIIFSGKHIRPLDPDKYRDKCYEMSFCLALWVYEQT